MPRFYLLMAGLALLSFRTRAQSTITNLQATNVTATAATVTFSGGSATGGLTGCGTLIRYAVAGGAWVNVPYAMPLQLTGLLPASAVEVQVTPRVQSGSSGPQRCANRPAATITFTTVAALAAGPAAEAGPVSLAPNPTNGSATLTLAAPLPQPAPLQVLDGLGRPVRQQLLPARATTAPLDVAGLPPGLYLVRCGAVTRRLVVE